MRERGAEGDPLLLAAGELARARVGAVEQVDPLEQLPRAAGALRAGDAAKAERQARRAPRP